MGVLIRAQNNAIERAVGKHQYALKRQPGAQRQVMAVRAASKCRPELALVTLDVKNAFGTVRWSDALQQAATHLPSVAVP
eukprot:3688592-Prorocentrum_lima.AAC.1